MESAAETAGGGRIARTNSTNRSKPGQRRSGENLTGIIKKSLRCLQYASALGVFQ